jgi:hypothetical protein
MMVEKKPKRKNPWIKRKAKKIFHERLERIETSSVVQNKLLEHKCTLDSVRNVIKTLEDMKLEYIALTKRDFVIESLPVETLIDSCEIENYGKSSKPKLKDLIKAGSIKRRGQKLIEEKNILVDESKIAQIDLLQIKIQELDRILGEE